MFNLCSSAFPCTTHIYINIRVQGSSSVIKSLWHFGEVYWIFYPPPTADINNGYYSHVYIFIYTTAYGWQGKAKLKCAVKQTGWSAANCFLYFHYSWRFSRLKARHKHSRSIQCFTLLTEPQDLREASLFDIAQVKSGKPLCAFASWCPTQQLSGCIPFFSHPNPSPLRLLQNIPPSCSEG